MENTPTLRTERLILRKFTQHDAEAVFAIYSDAQVNTFLPMFPLKTREEAGQFLQEQYLDYYERPAGNRYAICLKENDMPIGYVHVSDDDSHDFGYGLSKEFWNKGIVTEAGKAVLQQLNKKGAAYVTATHDVQNPRSGAVMKKLGMKYCYSYEERWQPKDYLVTFRLYQLNLDGREDRVYPKYWEQSSVHFIEKNV